jgi:hypothetical protein
MAKFKPYDYTQGVMLTVFLEEQLMPRTLEFAIHTLIDSAHWIPFWGSQGCYE